jgi:hypothetical protein
MLFRQVLLTGAAPKNSLNLFRNTTVLDPRVATLVVLGGEQGRDLLPMHVAQQRIGPRYRPSFGAADLVYLSSDKSQPPSFHRLVLGYTTASAI